MGNIVLLDELTINKIAAGEVIERPASVIKEMVENSIDAKAKNITIEIRNGGISYIKITDDGKGIAQDDLEMAFERHATSKIRRAEDLDTVTSMGFRGEALASIAAISNIELISKTENQEIGYKVVVEGGHVLNKEEIGCQTGTSIIVRNLFFNTPVRYKFLKKDYTETGYIEDVVTRIALINPDVAIKLVNTGKTILSTSGNGNLKDAVYSIYGKDIAQGLVEVKYKYEDVVINGVIGRPEIARSNRSNLLFFVNKRYIKDRLLTSATEQAYKNLIEIGKYAFVVLNLDIPPHKVDVNVHPAKLEVRFEEENKIFKAVYHAIEDALAKDRAASDNIEKMDNIIIQSSSEKIIPVENNNEEKEEKRFSSFLNRRKNKYDFGSNNIIEDLYNKKKQDEFEFMDTQIIKNNEIGAIGEIKNKEDENIVNTSDVLMELKSINENIKKDLDKEITKNENAVKEIEEETTEKEEKIEEVKEENKNLPDGKTYTYIGENKDIIESLLRQLHPEMNPVEKSVAEESMDFNLGKVEETINFDLNKIEDENENVENYFEEKQEDVIINDNLNVNKKFELIRQNLERMETQEIKVIAEENKETITENKNEEPKVEMSNSNGFNQMYEKLFGTKVINSEKENEKEEEKQQIQKINAIDIVNENVSVFEGIEEYNRPNYKIIGIVFDSYIMIQLEKEMYIINEKIAREKIMYEKLKNIYYNEVNKDSQMLLLPDIINLTEKQMEVVRENTPILTKAGFVFEEFGDNTIKLSGVPTVCVQLNTKELFYEIVEGINTVARTLREEKEEKIIEIIAEKVVLSTNEPITMQNAESLLDELFNCKAPFVYKENKQIALKMTKYDIERKFSRK